MLNLDRVDSFGRGAEFDGHRAVLADQVAPDGQQSGKQVEVLPAEAEQLAASCAGDEGQPDCAADATHSPLRRA